MKKYTTLPIDCTNLVSEAIAYLNQTTDVEDAEHHNSSFHWLGSLSELSTVMPSLLTTFSTLPLTVEGVAHRAINSTALYTYPVGRNVLFVPLMDFNNAELQFFTVSPNASLTIDGHYADEDCTLIESVPLNINLLVHSSGVYTIDNSSDKLADFLLIYFVENTDSLLAD